MKSQVPHPHPNKGRTPGLSSLSLRPRSVATAVLRTLQDHEEQTLSFQSSLVVVAKVIVRITMAGPALTSASAGEDSVVLP